LDGPAGATPGLAGAIPAPPSGTGKQPGQEGSNANNHNSNNTGFVSAAKKKKQTAK